MSSQQIEDAIRALAKSDPGLFSRANEGSIKPSAAELRKPASPALLKVSKAIVASKFPTLGNKNGAKTIAMFYDYNCVYCKEIAPVVERLIAENPDLKVFAIDLPVLGQGSKEASDIGLSFESVGRFKEAHKILMGLKPANKQTSARALASLAPNLDAMVAATRPESAAKLAASMDWAYQLQIQGTPHFIYIGKGGAEEQTGPSSIEEMRPFLSRI